jgi:hypothetical protein
MKTYRASDDQGHSVRINALSLSEAMSHAKVWCENGEWSDEGARVALRVIETELFGFLEIGEAIEKIVDIEPNHDAKIRDCAKGRHCGTAPNFHHWRQVGEVWGTNDTGLKYDEVCEECGLRRTLRYAGSQYHSGDHNTVEYSWPRGNDGG